MSIRRIAVVQAGLLLAAMLANAASQKDTVRITVLDSVTRASTTDNNNGVPLNCEQLTYDAYCRSTTNVPLISTLLVQEGNDPPFRISCTIESRYSRCIPLPKGESFDARKEKRGLTVYYVDDKGKERKQLYTLVDAGGKAGPAAAVAAQPVAAPVAPRQSSPVPAPASPAPAPSVGSVQAVPAEKAEKVKCNFSSTPPGAEITLDGKYVGSTPSEIPISTGTHVVIFSMPGFAEWRRDLTVEAGSVVNVTATLQKAQP
ncbi:MAG: PEGA domain-containing protein [Verrucomicrobiia bacterium]